MFLSEDLWALPRKQVQALEGWCDEDPIVGFNSGKYYLNLIKEHFVEHLL